MPVRPAHPADLPAILSLYAASCRHDPTYLPFLDPDNTAALHAWFHLKPLTTALVATTGNTVIGFAGLRDAIPPALTPTVNTG